VYWRKRSCGGFLRTARTSLCIITGRECPVWFSSFFLFCYDYHY
jgi:hypothetical protein